MFAFLSAPVDTPTFTVPILPIAYSIAYNNIGAEGASTLAAVLKETQIQHLECAALEGSLMCQCPVDTPPPLGSLEVNQLCGLDYYGHGEYTTEGITKLCEALMSSAVTSLKCAATPSEPVMFAFVSAPIDRQPSALAPPPMLAVSRRTDSALMEEPLSPRASRATPRCNR